MVLPSLKQNISIAARPRSFAFSLKRPRIKIAARADIFDLRGLRRIDLRQARRFSLKFEVNFKSKAL